nr:hypothetical protein [Tanacetum cinerariifolium]
MLSSLRGVLLQQMDLQSLNIRLEEIRIKRRESEQWMHHMLLPQDLRQRVRRHDQYKRDLQGNDLLTGNRGSDLYTISLQESTSSTPLCLMAKATSTQAWLWHRRLSHLNFNNINLLSKNDIVIGLSKLSYVKDQLCSSCEWSKAKRSSFKSKIVQLILFIVNSGYTKHMTGNLKLLCNFVEKFMGTVRFGNDQFVPILGYGDLVQGNVTINRVYYVKGLNHNLFSVESTSSTPLCLMAKATPTQAWLWHRRLSHLNFDYINLLSKKNIVIGLPKLKYVKDQLCSSCKLSKAKRSSFKSKVVPSSKGRLNFLHIDLCRPM